ncbi:MAG: hypothetical protein K0Q77_2489 [Anaerosporomusa subterranea]|jgi:hypothetical protein|nr:hypothetical protein [Anaerosporomusa subterranea]
MFYLIFNWNGQLLEPAGNQMDNLFSTNTVIRPIPLNANCF